MKSSFIVSLIEKHLDVRNIQVSAFFNQHSMYDSIGKCLSECGIMIVRSMI